MLHDDRFEDEYRRAKEKSERTGKPMEIDHRGRPLMPRWPLVSGVLPFLEAFGAASPISSGLLASMGFAAAAWLLQTGIEVANSEAGAFIGVPKIGGGTAILMMTTAAAYSCLLQIIMESSEGNRAICHWPVFTDWLASLLWFGVAVPFSAIPGWAIGHIPGIGNDPHVPAAITAASILIFLPIIMLSQLDINSPAGLFSGRILASFCGDARSRGCFCILKITDVGISDLRRSATYLCGDKGPLCRLAVVDAVVRGCPDLIRTTNGPAGVGSGRSDAYRRGTQLGRLRPRVATTRNIALRSETRGKPSPTSRAGSRVHRGCCVGSTNRSGCGISPNTRPVSSQTPAIFPIAPLGLSG